MKKVETLNAPRALPYSQGVFCGDFLYVSGQCGFAIDGTPIPGDIAYEIEQACINVGAILEAAHTDYEHVVKTTCYLINMADLDVFNKVYLKYFVSNPACSCVSVRGLPKGARCLIEVVAYIGE